MPKVLIGNVAGPKGPKGDKGDQGPEGPQGPQGEQGNINAGSTVSFTEALERENIKSGESCATIFGKIKKFFTDLKTVAFTGSYSDLLDKPTLGSAAGKDVANNLTTSDSSHVLDARQGKALNEAKLDKNNVVNNLTTTEEGYALDARQGKEINGNIVELKEKSYEIIKTQNGYIKKYNNGVFEAWAKTSIQNTSLEFTQIGSTNLHYARYTNFNLGITATEIYNIQTSAMNNGVVWAARPSLNANKGGVDGYIIQIGADKAKTTYLDAYVAGKWE